MTRTPPPSFVSLLRVQQESLLRAARLLTGDWTAAEELLRRTLAWALANWGTFEEDGTPAALVVRLRMVALFLADVDLDAESDQLPGGSGGAPTVSGASSAFAAGGASGGSAADLGNGSGQPDEPDAAEPYPSVWAEDATVTIRPSTSLLDSLAVLAPKDRVVVVGRYYLSLSATEIAGMLGIMAEDVDAAAVSILAGLRRRVAHIGGHG